MISGFRLIQGTLIQTELHTEKRRTLAMRFLNRTLIIKAPKDAHPAQIEAWLNRKEAWILKSYRISEQSHTEDGKVWIFNRKRDLEFKPGATLDYHLEGDRLLIIKPQRLGQESALKRVYDDLAQTVILPLFKDAVEMTRYHPKEVRFKAMKGSWGRCHSSGVITLSLKLLECDPEFIRYVCVHELVHLRHMNHSKAFWQAVSSFMPDYKERRKLTPYALRASL